MPANREKDGHHYRRYNDCNITGDRLLLPQLGREMFLEQLPVWRDTTNYGTYRISWDLQIELVEARQYWRPNAMPDGSCGSIWGRTQREGLVHTLKESDAIDRRMMPSSETTMPISGDSNMNEVHGICS